MFKRRRDESTTGEESGSTEPPAATPAPPPPAEPLFGVKPPSDPGVGVPPFRPAQAQKEPPAMARAPFTSTPAPNQPPPTASLPPRPTAMPGSPMGASHPSQPSLSGPSPGSPGPHQRQQPQEKRTLVIGKGISLQGVIQDAERLVVEGTVEAQLLHASELAVAPSGIFKGEVEVEDAEIAGVIDGAVTARSALVIRSTGKVIGTARCRRLQVEDGGQISGRIEMITDAGGGKD